VTACLQKTRKERKKGREKERKNKNMDGFYT
jgi:hypothetical protein